MIGSAMAVDEQLLSEIVRRILSVTRPEKVILFGSAASGRMDRDSDIDLLVLERDPQNARHESVRIGDALLGLGFPFDVIVMDTERFEETRSLIGGIARPADKTGKIIYEAA